MKFSAPLAEALVSVCLCIYVSVHLPVRVCAYCLHPGVPLCVCMCAAIYYCKMLLKPLLQQLCLLSVVVADDGDVDVA